jgi:hypothetical protein
MLNHGVDGVSVMKILSPTMKRLCKAGESTSTVSSALLQGTCNPLAPLPHPSRPTSNMRMLSYKKIAHKIVSASTYKDINRYIVHIHRALQLGI